MTHEQHQAALLAAFAGVLKAEGEVAQIKEWVASAQADVARHEASAAEAWAAVEALLADTGEVEARLPSSTPGHEFRIYRPTPREAVAVGAVDSLPDEFTKTDRKARLKEIGDHLRALRDRGEPMPNWATLRAGEARLAYRLQKRGVK